MLDVPVLPADQVRGGVHRYFNDGVQYESSVDTGQWILGSNGFYETRGGISLIHLDVPHRILDSKIL